MTDHEQDPMDDLVRRALAREAEQVRPDPDGLYEIRRRLSRTGEKRRPWLWAVTGAGVAAAAAAAIFAVGGDAIDDGADQPAAASDPTTVIGPTDSDTATPAATPTAPGFTTPGPTAPRVSSASTGSSSPTASQTVQRSEPVPAGRSAVPVYWLGRTVGRADTGQRLYRSFVQVKGDPALGAVSTMTTGRPADPDYSSPWTGARPLSVVRRAGLITVDFDALPKQQLGSQDSRTAVQQLVYTVQGVMRATEPVQVTLRGGSAGRLFGSTDTAKPFGRAAQVDVQAWIWITAPDESAVARSPLTVTGVASTFEATVDWRVRDLGSGRVVRTGSTTAGAGTGEFGDYKFQVTLPSGKYRIECLELSAEDGHETNTDTKTFVVR